MQCNVITNLFHPTKYHDRQSAPNILHCSMQASFLPPVNTNEYVWCVMYKFCTKKCSISGCWVCLCLGLVSNLALLKGGITHTVSPNLMLILSAYRVVLHPSSLQKVFSFIIFIKERNSFTILSKKSSAPGGGVPWAELKSDKYLSAITSKHTFDAVSITVCSSESWPGSGADLTNRRDKRLLWAPGN